MTTFVTRGALGMAGIDGVVVVIGFVVVGFGWLGWLAWLGWLGWLARPGDPRMLEDDPRSTSPSLSSRRKSIVFNSISGALDAPHSLVYARTHQEEEQAEEEMEEEEEDEGEDDEVRMIFVFQWRSPLDHFSGAMQPVQR